MIVAAYLVEAGLILVVAPWTVLWESNYFVGWFPWLEPIMANQFARGAVSGIGLVTAIAGLRDLAGAFFKRDRQMSPDA